MKRQTLYLLLFIVLINSFRSFGQGAGNKWFCYTTTVIDFSGPVPVLATPPASQTPPFTTSAFPGYYPEEMGVQAAVCKPNGELQFFVKILKIGASGLLPSVYPGWPKIFDRNGYSMPNGDIDVKCTDFAEQPLIIPQPGDSNLYYVFYIKNEGLKYSLVDMTLNNGLGDVVTTQKDISLTTGHTVNGVKLTAVKGCKGVWLVIRSMMSNLYFSYLVDANGLHSTPVVSDCGELPLEDYNSISIHDGINWAVGFGGAGRLVASKDGTMLAAGCRHGVELYDFEKCSGRVKNPRVIDTFPFFGLCFSPDNSRLYASQVYPLPHYGLQGQVYQFDLSQSSPQAITNSKTLILSNEVAACYNVFSLCYCDTISTLIGDLRLGPDNQIYMSNCKRNCTSSSVPVPPATSVYPYHALHVIHNPNALGLACNPELDYLQLNTSSGNLATTNYGALFFLPNTIVTASPAAPDTVAGVVTPITVCFRDSTKLTIPETYGCPVWDNGSTERERTVSGSGTYFVRYFQDCSISTDTFHVTFVPLPDVPLISRGCPGEIAVRIKNKAGDATEYTYTLESNAGNLIQTGASNTQYEFNNLGAGDYTLNVQTQTCDTSLKLHLEAYPKPELAIDPQDTAILYGERVRLHVKGANLYIWSPSGSLDTATIANPLASPSKPTVYTVVGINEHGCRDTGYVHIDIDYTMPDMIPNAFSPNGDGLNDVFRIEGVTYQKVLAFNIFNRYGQRVFSTLDGHKGWDGTQNGKPCDAGTYYYLIKLDYPSGLIRTYKGDITLIR